jgi:hypothetical protein
MTRVVAIDRSLGLDGAAMPPTGPWPAGVPRMIEPGSCDHLVIGADSGIRHPQIGLA